MSNNKIYFSEVQQKAVIDYKYSTSTIDRNRIYTKLLHKPFKQMTAAIIRRYPIHTGRFELSEIEDMALHHLIENFENFDEWKPEKLKITFAKEKSIKNLLKNPDLLSSKTQQIKVRTNNNFEVCEIKNISMEKELFDILFEKMMNIKTIYYYENFILNVFVSEILVNNKTQLAFDFKNTEPEINEKNLIEYYREKLGLVNNIENKCKKLKYGFYCPITEERKAFSYCQTIIRNFLKDHSKKTYEKKLNESEILFDTDSAEYSDYDYLYGYCEIQLEEDLKDYVFNQFYDNLIKNIKNELKTNEFLTKEEIITGDSLVYILENWSELFEEDMNTNNITKKLTDNYIKRKFFLLLCERTKMDNKQLKANMKRFGILYKYDIFNLNNKTD